MTSPTSDEGSKIRRPQRPVIRATKQSLLGATMTPGANVTEVGAEIDRTLKRIEQDLPLGVELGRISDQAQGRH